MNECCAQASHVCARMSSCGVRGGRRRREIEIWPERRRSSLGGTWSIVPSDKEGSGTREMTPAPGVVGHAVVLEEQSLQRHMGCMAGFLQLFDRNHVLAGRRSFSTRRVPTSPTAASTSQLESSEASSVSFFKESQPRPSSPGPCLSPPESHPSEETPVPARRSLPLPLQVFETSDGAKTSWRIRDTPRLSLDSRAVVDARGKLRPRDIRTTVPVTSADQYDASEAAEDQHRSPSVVARLMGLEVLPSVCRNGGTEPDRAELRRSASESRVRKDPSNYEFADAGSFIKPQRMEPALISAEKFFKSVSLAQLKLHGSTKTKPPSRTNLLQRKFFDADDFFPDPKRSGMLYGEIERRLRMRGIEEPAKDMETLKQILEALQLKGLLHSNPPDRIVNVRRSLIFDYQSRTHGDAPIVVMKPASKSARPSSNELPPRSVVAGRKPLPVRQERTAINRLVRGGNERRSRGLKSQESPNSPVNRRPPMEQKSTQPQRRISSVNSPKSSPRRSGPDPLAARSPRRSRPPADATPEANVYTPAEDDTSTTFSESSISASSQLDFERSRAEEYGRQGRTLLEDLERCGKLVHSIEAFTAAEQQPSPVSVLDSLSYLGEEGSPSPSPLAKRSIAFHDRSTDDWEESKRSPPGSTYDEDPPGQGDHDYAYVCEVVRACGRYGESCDAVYAILEKRRCHLPGEARKPFRLHRRLVFDTVTEILDRKRRLAQWDAFSSAVTAPSVGTQDVLLQQVWAEVCRIREPTGDGDDDDKDDEAGGQEAAVASAVRKEIDTRRADAWTRPSANLSDAVLYIEQLIFKDLVADTIRELSAAAAASAAEGPSSTSNK